MALLLAAAMMAAPDAALAEERRGALDRIGGWTFDLLILRPVSLTQTVGGSAVLLVAYPISIPSGQQNTVLERCTLAPFEDTFERRLGDF